MKPIPTNGGAETARSALRGKLHAVALCLLALTADAAAPRPNVVVLLSDDLGFRDLGCDGDPVHTPHLDRLAAAGTRFSDFYSRCAVCSPSRATLLTGRQHLRTGVYSWIDDERERVHLLTREVTLAEVLRQAGYATAHFGKWHLGLPTVRWRKPTPSDHGFDYWFATSNNADPSQRNPETFVRNGTPTVRIEGYACQIVVDEALTWLERHRSGDRPFFLNVWFHEPHGPRAAPDEIVARYGKSTDIMARYSATIEHSDRAIGRLLAQLAEVAPGGETLIIYSSDNGSVFEARTTPLRGNKGTNWDGGIRVPGMFVWPGHIAAGRTERTPAGLVDVLPTICGLLGLAPPAGVHLDGSDLSPLLQPRDRRTFTRQQPLFWHLYKSRPMVALRGDWACHTIDAPFWALQLGAPTSVEAEVSELHPEFVPRQSTIRYEFPARGNLPPVKLTWHEGGARPEKPAGWDEGELPPAGMLMIGSRNTLFHGSYPDSPRLVSSAAWEQVKRDRPRKRLPRVEGGHMQEWFRACKGEGPAPGSNFDYAADLSQVALLGVVAMRAGKRLAWDNASGRITNHPSLQRHIEIQAHQGWKFH